MKICWLTGKKCKMGNSIARIRKFISGRSKRKFSVNLQYKRYYISSIGKWYRIRLSKYAMRLIALYSNNIEALLISNCKRLMLAPRIKILRRNIIRAITRNESV